MAGPDELDRGRDEGCERRERTDQWIGERAQYEERHHCQKEKQGDPERAAKQLVGSWP